VYQSRQNGSIKTISKSSGSSNGVTRWRKKHGKQNQRAAKVWQKKTRGIANRALYSVTRSAMAWRSSNHKRIAP